MRLVDSHAHLDDSRFDADRAACIERARRGSVRGIINVGIDRQRSHLTVGLASEYEGMWAAVGVHPHAAKSYVDDDFNWLKQLLRRPEVVAVGEIGLDYHHNFSPPQQQREVFRRILQLAVSEHYPVVVHNREADEDCFDILGEVLPAGHPVLLHCFAGGPMLMQRAVDRGYHIALGGVVTFSGANETQKVARQVPPDRLLLETDCPYLTPQPHRGKRNEPAYVRHVAEKIASLRKQPVDLVARATAENAERFFGIELPSTEEDSRP